MGKRKNAKAKQQPPDVDSTTTTSSPILEAEAVTDAKKATTDDASADVLLTTAEEEEEEEQQELELLQVDLGDMVKMKQVLDEAVSAAILEDEQEEDYRWDNAKLALMALSCVFAMIAQFAPIPFPESRLVLGVCGSLYFILSGILQYITTFIDRDAILLTKPLSENTGDGGSRAVVVTKSDNPLLEKYGLRVRSSLPRFSEYYTVILEFKTTATPQEVEKALKQNKNARKTASPQELLPIGVDDLPALHVRQTWSVGQFFDQEGSFDEIGLMDEVLQLYRRLQASDYDDDTIVGSSAVSTKKTQ